MTKTIAHSLSAKARRAVKAYGEEACLKAYRMHYVDGYGSRGIAYECWHTIRTTRQASAAIDAGEELVNLSRA